MSKHRNNEIVHEQWEALINELKDTPRNHKIEIRTDGYDMPYVVAVVDMFPAMKRALGDIPIDITGCPTCGGAKHIRNGNSPYCMVPCPTCVRGK